MATDIKRNDLFFVNPSMIIVEDGFNARYDYGDIDGLAQSIIEHGVKVPLRGKKTRGKDEYTLTDGHRRFRAVQRAIELGYTDIKVPIIPEGKDVSEADRVLGMIVYNDGKRLTLLEEAVVYSRLIGYGWTQAEIAKKVSKSQTHVANCLLLKSAPEIVKKRIMEGKVSASLVIEEMKQKAGSDVAAELEAAIANNGRKKVRNKDIIPKRPKMSEVLDSLFNNSKIAAAATKTLQLWMRYQEGDLSYEDLVRQLEEL